MIPFLVSPIGRRIGIGVLAVALLGWGYRIITNRAYEKGIQSGRVAGAEDLRKEMESKWNAERAGLELERANIDAIAEKNQQDRAALNRIRSNFEQETARTFAAIAAHNVEERQRVQELSSDRIVPAIRAALSELLAIERSRVPAPQ